MKLVHTNRTELNFDGECSAPGCRRDVTPGIRFCSKHSSGGRGGRYEHTASKRHRAGYWSDAATHLLTLPPKHPPPAWLSDPSLLPKRPPRCAS